MHWARARLNELVSGDCELPSVTRTLRLGGLDEWSDGRAFKRWLPDDRVLNVDGSMFGGHLAALADQMAAFAAMSVLPEGAAYRTINLALQFYRIGRNHPLNIESRVTAQSRNLISVETDFRRDDGVLLARASAQQMIVPMPS